MFSVLSVVKFLLFVLCLDLRFQDADLMVDIAEALRPSTRTSFAERLSRFFPLVQMDLGGGEFEQARRL